MIVTIKNSIKQNKWFKKFRNNTKLYIFIRHPLLSIRYRIKVRMFKNLKIMSIEDSISMVKTGKYSVSRFGDGELRWILNLEIGYFQQGSKKLGESLKRALNDDDENMLIGLPNVFNSVDELRYDDSVAWKRLVIEYGDRWSKIIPMDKIYIDANITRPYIDREDRDRSEYYFKSLKEIWDNKNVVIIEGDKTRFGIGNTFIENALSVKRIICPSVNAFEKYSDILQVCKSSIVGAGKKDTICLVALGPTATVLTCDLAKEGLIAFDIGHLDIEYEWYEMKTDIKVPIKNKYVNEVNGGGNISKEFYDEKYDEQIWKVIK